MDYKKLKFNVKDLRTKHREARQELEALQARRDVIGGDIEDARQTLVEATANMQAGEGSPKTAKDAKSALKLLTAEAAELPSQIEIAERAVSILKERVVEAELQLSQTAYHYYRDKLDPHFEKIDQALDAINDEIEVLNGYRMDLQADKVSDSIFRGLDRNSQAIISKKKLASIEIRNFIRELK